MLSDWQEEDFITRIYSILKRKNWNNTESRQLSELVKKIYDLGKDDKLRDIKAILEIEDVAF